MGAMAVYQKYREKKNCRYYCFCISGKGASDCFRASLPDTVWRLWGEVCLCGGNGVQDTSARVENNEVLKHIRMSQEKAETLTKLTEYVEVNGLFGKEVLLYGNVPALSFYLQMPSAFNPWSDLRS